MTGVLRTTSSIVASTDRQRHCPSNATSFSLHLEAARRMSCSNNMKQIGLASLNHESTYNRLPPSLFVDIGLPPGSTGQPGAPYPAIVHCWSIYLLPYIEQNQVYLPSNLCSVDHGQWCRQDIGRSFTQLGSVKFWIGLNPTRKFLRL